MITNEKVFKAYLTLQKFGDIPMAFAKAKILFNVKQKLQSAYDFIIQEQKKIFEAHPSLDIASMTMNMEGMNEDQRKATILESKEIEAKLKELTDMDSGLQEESPVKLKLSDESEVKISAKDIENLAVFIEIE